MSLRFSAVSSQYLENSSAVLTGVTLTMCCWAKFIGAFADQTLMSLTDNSVLDNYHALMMQGGGTDEIRARTRAGGTADAVTSAGVSVGPWHHCAGVWIGAASRAAFLDGANKGTDVTSQTPTGINTTAIGRLSASTPGIHADANIAEAAIWNVALTDAEIAQLALGISPLLIRPTALVAYWPIYNGGADSIGSFNLTAFNGPTLSDDHAPLLDTDPLQVGTNPFVPKQINASVSNSFTLGQTLVSVFEFTRLMQNSLTFAQIVTVVAEFNRRMENILLLNNFPETNIKQASLQSVIFFDSTVDKAFEIAVSLVSVFLLEQKAQRTIEESVSNSFLMDSFLAFGGDPSNTVLFESFVTAVNTKGQRNSVGFGQSLSVEKESNLVPSNAVGFGNSVIGIVIEACDLFEYDPVNALNPDGLEQPPDLVLAGTAPSIQLTCDANIITLRNPELGNTYVVDSRRARNITRGGQNRVFRDQNWPRTVEQTINFDVLTRIEAQDLLTFFKNCLGKEVTFVDQNDLTWVGIITGPKDPITEVTGDDCHYRGQVTFISAVDAT